jgi:hypothetical protein
MRSTKQDAKKRIMFIQKEDYNFLTYNFLLILKYLDANSKESKFHDFRKISYLIQFISTNPNFKEYEKNELSQIYSKSHLKKQLLSHLILILKNRNIIGVDVNYHRNSLDVWLNEGNIPQEFFDKKLFNKEIENIKYLRSELPRLKILTLKTVVDAIFTTNKVITWEV